jgi:hypothetical protein
MRLSLAVPLMIAALIVAFAQQPMPRMVTVEPAAGKVGDVISVAGEHLAKSQVAKVYLTDGDIDLELEVTD